jgi:hypothetical protein
MNHTGTGYPLVSWDWAVFSVLIAVLASSLTYIYSVKTTTKSLLFGAKLNAYGAVIALYFDIFDNLEKILYLEEIDASKEDRASTNIWNIQAELYGLGDSETLLSMMDTDSRTRENEETGAAKHAERLQMRAIILSSKNVTRCYKEVRIAESRLSLVGPGKDVKDATDRAHKIIVSCGGVLLRNIAAEHPKFFGGIDLSDIQGVNIVSRLEWKMDAEIALVELTRTMKMDLIHTVRINPFPGLSAATRIFEKKP